MKATLITTDLQKGHRWQSQELQPGGVDAIHQISIYPEIRKQVFQGFGGAFTESSAYNYQKLPQARREAFLEAYFGKTGLGYTLGRVHIGSCDFSLNNYSCREAADAPFDTSRDEQYLVPLIQEAQAVAGKPIHLMLSPWSPPAFMKTNGERNHGGKLLPEYWELWASYMAEYINFYRSRGLDVKQISIQNEPAAVQTWDSCIYSAQEEGRFAAEALYPAMKKAGCQDVTILAWDHNKEILPYRAAGTMSVPGAQAAIGGFAIHWYTGDHFDALSLVRQQYPGKELWFTEGCVEYSRFDGSSNLQKAEMYAHDILGNLIGGISGSLDWNLLLDAKGGPNHVGNFCEAPIMLLEDESDFEIRSEYYYIGQFSRYIQPGAVCLGSSAYNSALEAVALGNPDGSIVAVLLNRSDAPQHACVTLNAEQGYHHTLAPHSIATLVLEEGV